MKCVSCSQRWPQWEGLNDLKEMREWVILIAWGRMLETEWTVNAKVLRWEHNCHFWGRTRSLWLEWRERESGKWGERDKFPFTLEGSKAIVMTWAFTLSWEPSEDFEWHEFDLKKTNKIFLATEGRTDMKRTRIEAGEHLGEACNLVRDDGDLD